MQALRPLPAGPTTRTYALLSPPSRVGYRPRRHPWTAAPDPHPRCRPAYPSTTRPRSTVPLPYPPLSSATRSVGILILDGCQAEKMHAELSVHTVLPRRLDRRLHLRRRLSPSSRGWVPVPHLNIHSYPCSGVFARYRTRRQYRHPRAPQTKTLTLSLPTNMAPPPPTWPSILIAPISETDRFPDAATPAHCEWPTISAVAHCRRSHELSTHEDSLQFNDTELYGETGCGILRVPLTVRRCFRLSTASAPQGSRAIYALDNTIDDTERVPTSPSIASECCFLLSIF